MRWIDDIGVTIDKSKAAAKLEFNDNNLDYHARFIMDAVVGNIPTLEVISHGGFSMDTVSVDDLAPAMVTNFKEAVDSYTDLETTAFLTLGSRPLRLPRPTQRDSIFPDAYPQSPILVYKNVQHASFHMAICIMRVGCLTHLQALALYSKFGTGFQQIPAYQTMLLKAKDDIETIVSSVPFICGWTADGTNMFPDVPEATPQSCRTSSAISWISWILANLSTNPLVTEEQKNYLTHMTRYVADVRRVRLAGALLDATIHNTTRESLSRWHRKI